MEKTGLKQYDVVKLEKAILYAQRIAEGCNPVNNAPVEEDSVLHNPNVIRCMHFIKEVLEDVHKNRGYVGGKPKNSNKQPFPADVRNLFKYKEDKPISRVVEQINEPLDEYAYQKLSYKTVTKWLLRQGYLQELAFEKFENKSFKVPTENGMQLGIRTEERVRTDGAGYVVTLYGQQAQEFIVEHLEAMRAGEAEEKMRESTTEFDSGGAPKNEKPV